VKSSLKSLFLEQTFSRDDNQIPVLVTAFDISTAAFCYFIKKFKYCSDFILFVISIVNKRLKFLEPISVNARLLRSNSTGELQPVKVPSRVVSFGFKLLGTLPCVLSHTYTHTHTHTLAHTLSLSPR